MSAKLIIIKYFVVGNDIRLGRNAYNFGLKKALGKWKNAGNIGKHLRCEGINYLLRENYSETRTSSNYLCDY